MTSNFVIPRTKELAPEEGLTRVQTRFEAWLRSRGYQPVRDPFVPEAGLDGSARSDDATDLVGEYLEDSPAEEPNRDLLMGHALAIRDVMPLWGDSVGCDLALGQ